MNYSEVEYRINNLNVWKRGDHRAPHKPLLLLYAIGRYLRGDERLLPYKDIDRDLKKLLLDFGPPRKSQHPEYPFWRLQSDGLWEILGANELQKRKSNSDVPKTVLMNNNVHGGIIAKIYDLLIFDKNIANNLIRKILNDNFPDSIHEDILQAVGINIENGISKIRSRDASFRNKVLCAYEYQCAVCGFNVRIGDSLVALEAAHIKWHQAGGPDIENNGIALCTMHHKLFDRGAFTINENMILKVSQIAHGTHGFSEWLMNFHNKSIKTPQTKLHYPQDIFVIWHTKEVFKGYSRE